MGENTKIEYRDIKGFPGYRVGTDGSVLSCMKNGGNDRTSRITNRWRRLNGWIAKRRGKKTGYLKVGLMRNGKTHKVLIHRLVLEAFVGPRPDGMEARHLDDNKENVSLSNLKWGTRLENSADAIRNGVRPMGEKNHKAVLRKKDIPAIRQMLFDGIPRRKIAAHFSVSKSTIDAIYRGKTWREVA